MIREIVMQGSAWAIYARNPCTIEIDVLLVDVSTQVGFSQGAEWPRPVHSSRGFLRPHAVRVVVVGHSGIGIDLVLGVVGRLVAVAIVNHVAGDVVRDTCKLILSVRGSGV